MSTMKRSDLIKEYMNDNKTELDKLAVYEKSALDAYCSHALITNRYHDILKSLAELVRDRKNSTQVDSILSRIEKNLKESLDYSENANNARHKYYLETVISREKTLKLLDIQYKEAVAIENTKTTPTMNTTELLNELKLMMELNMYSTTKIAIQECINKVIQTNLDYINSLQSSIKS